MMKSKSIKGRFYCDIELSNGERSMLVIKATDKADARSIINKTYKVSSILNVSDTYNGVRHIPNLYGSSLVAYNSAFHSGNRTTKRGSK
jgi:hypothetical protein